MRLLSRTAVPFVVGMVLFPSCILVHEWGHTLAGRWLGLETHLHFAVTTFNGPREQITPGVDLVIVSAGPLINFVLMVLGCLWLWWLRRTRRAEPATSLDWIATAVAMNAGRWLRGFSGTPSNPQPKDEANMSTMLGLPGWLLPYALTLMALVVMTAIIRQHPSGQRLRPISALMIGGIIGCALWMWLIGPAILP